MGILVLLILAVAACFTLGGVTAGVVMLAIAVVIGMTVAVMVSLGKGRTYFRG